MANKTLQTQPPPNYLVFAIIVTIFCGKIFGIIAIIFAAQVNSKWAAGDYEGAMTASRNAKLWSWISFAVMFVWIVVMVVSFVFFGVFAGVASVFNL